jgi:hypothetical protein
VLRASKSSHRYSRKSMGDAGKPWGMLVEIGYCWLVCLLNESIIVLSVRNVEYQDSTGFRQLSCYIM